MLTTSQAKEIILDNTIPTQEIQTKNLLDSCRYSLAESILADRDYPPFPRATMDGYALVEKDLQTNNQFSLIGEVFAGDNWDYPHEVLKNSCVKIMTGAKVPNNFDTVIKVEDTLLSGNNVQINTTQFFKGLNIAKQGEDTTKGTSLISVGTLIDDSVLTIAGSFGYSKLKVFELPKVSIVSTGNEVLPEGVEPLAHQIRDSNSITLNAMLKKFQIEPIRNLQLKDDSKILKQELGKCLDSDICILTGGVSAGEADYIPSVLKSLGVEEIFHKVKIRPGKPIWFGKKDKTLIFGLPGNPVSARVTFKIFVEPCIRKFLQLEPIKPIYFPILKSRKKKHDLEEYFRVKIINQENQTFLEEIPSNGSGDFIGSLSSDGLAIHQADNKELPVNSIIPFLFW